METGQVTVDIQGAVCTLTLDRPSRLNALSPTMMRQLREAYDAIAEHRVRAVVLRGNEKAFCAGADIEPLSEVDGPGSAWDYLDGFRHVYRGLRDLPCPTICVVRGHCLGAGAELCLAADLVVASPSARFGLPEVRLGAVPGFAMVELPAVVGRQRALDLLLTGRTIDAATALEWGLVSQVADEDALDAVVAGLVEQFAAAAPIAVATIKRAVARQTTDHAWEDFVTSAALNLTSADRRRGTAAFLDKRRPTFEGS